MRAIPHVRPEKRQMNSMAKGLIFAAAAAAAYGTNPLFALPLYKLGMSSSCVLVFRYFIAAVILGALAFFRNGTLKLPHGTFPAAVSAGVLLSVSSITLFESYRHMNVGLASTILFVYPAMVAVIMAVFYRERLSALSVTGIAASMPGIALLSDIVGGQTSFTGIALVLASSLSYAVFIVETKESRLRTIPPDMMIFYAVCCGIPVFTAAAGLREIQTYMTSPEVWAFSACLALFPTLISFVFTAAAIKLAGPTPTSVLGALEPVTAVLIGTFVFGEHLTTLHVSGIAIVIISVTLVVADGMRTSRKPENAPPHGNRMSL